MQFQSFFSTVRLTGIAAQQYSPSLAKYVTVGSYALSQTFPTTDDGTSPTVWLASITRTGSGTTGGGSAPALTLRAVKFTGRDLPNRMNRSTGCRSCTGTGSPRPPPRPAR